MAPGAFAKGSEQEVTLRHRQHVRRLAGDQLAVDAHLVRRVGVAFQAWRALVEQYATQWRIKAVQTSGTAQVDGQKVSIDADPKVVPVIVSGRTLLPLRFVAEALGLDVQWDATTKKVTITYDP